MCSASATKLAGVGVAQQDRRALPVRSDSRAVRAGRRRPSGECGLRCCAGNGSCGGSSRHRRSTDSRPLRARSRASSVPGPRIDGSAPPCLSCSICTRNSMSTVPPGPRLRLRFEAVSSSRIRIWRISVANSGRHGGPNAASATDLHRVLGRRRRCRARRAPCTAPAAPKVGRGLRRSSGRTRRTTRPASRSCRSGASRASTSYSRPYGPSWLHDADQPLAELAEEMAVAWCCRCAPRLPAERVAARFVQERSGRDRCGSSARGRRACRARARPARRRRLRDRQSAATAAVHRLVGGSDSLGISRSSARQTSRPASRTRWRRSA